MSSGGGDGSAGAGAVAGTPSYSMGLLEILQTTSGTTGNPLDHIGQAMATSGVGIQRGAPTSPLPASMGGGGQRGGPAGGGGGGGGGSLSAALDVGDLDGGAGSVVDAMAGVDGGAGGSDDLSCIGGMGDEQGLGEMLSQFGGGDGLWEPNQAIQ